MSSFIESLGSSRVDALHAIVGMSPGHLHTVPFSVEHEEAVLESLDTDDWLRVVDRAVFIPSLSAAFDLGCFKPNTKRLVFAAFVCVRGDLCADATKSFLESLVTPGATLPSVAALGSLCIPSPLGLFTLTRYLHGPPSQRTTAERHEFLSSFSRDCASDGFVSLGARGSRVSGSSSEPRVFCDPAGRDPALHAFTIDELLVTVRRFLQAGHQVAKHQILDSFGALVHQCSNSDFEYHCKPDSFVIEEIRSDYEECQAPLLAVWNLLAEACSKLQPSLLESVRHLYRLCGPVMKQRKGRLYVRLYEHVHFLVLFSILGHIMAFHFPTQAAPAGMLTPAWFHGQTILSDHALEYSRVVSSLWDRVYKAKSFRRVAAEIQAQLPFMVASRAACCFSNRVVTTVKL